jgi:DNA-binding CsgD family transcriptional regulator
LSKAPSGTRLGEAAGLLLERERELQAIEVALDRLAEGAGSLLIVEGPAGIGKTHLLAEATELARGRDLRVRPARGGELEREMPFGVARQLFESVVERASAEERSQLLAGSAELSLLALGREDAQRRAPASDPVAPIHGLYWLVANLAETGPMALVVDDAHWLDRQTLRFLVYLARRLDDIPVLAIASVRSGEPGQPPELDPLRAEGQVLRPAPLSPGAVEELIAATLDARPDPEFAAVCAVATAGNPFLLAEVMRTLRADRVPPSGAAAEAIAQLGPKSVARYVLIRLGRFGEDAIELARAIAVLGGAPQLRHAARLARLEERHTRELCDDLRDAEILALGHPIEFVHPLVRSAIYRELSEGERSALHRRAAEVLRDSGQGARELALHLMSCAPNGDQWVVAQLGEAAWDAIRAGAYDSAQAYLARALQEPPEDELPLLWALGKVMIQTDLANAPRLLGDVADRASDAGMRRRALRDLGLANLVAGEWSGAARAYAAALENVPEDDREQRLTLESQIYCIRTGIGSRDAATSRRMATVARGAAGPGQGECLARQALAFERFLDCAPVEEVIELARSFPAELGALRLWAPFYAIKVLTWSGRWEEARAAISRDIELSRGVGMLIAVSYDSGFLAEVDRLAGRLVDAEAAARTGWEIAAELAPSSNFGLAAAANLIATLISQGRIEEAARWEGVVDLSDGIRDAPVTPWPLEVRGYLRLARGSLEDGLHDLLEFGEQAELGRFRNPAASPWRQEVVPALAALDRADEAKELIAVAEERARKFGAAHVIGTVLRARGLIEPKKRAVETLRQSVAALDQYGPPHELARSLVELGAALRRSGSRSESREPLRRGLELAHRAGAGGIEARAREELAAAGSRPRRVFRTGVAALTASELRCAKLAAEGRSNVEIAQRLFVTRKTVEKHLGNVYSKLEIGGRGELAATLAQQASQSETPADRGLGFRPPDPTEARST